MGKKEIFKQFEKYDKSFLDYIYMLDTTDTKKMVPFLIKMMESEKKNNKRIYDERYFKAFTKVGVDNEFDRLQLFNVVNLVGGSENIDTLHDFIDHLNQNRIPEKDVSKYDSWKDIERVVSVANISKMEKELKKQVLKVYEDETYLLIKPLSFESSKAYGSSTKWCTTMVHDPSYFYRYSRDGILLYVINKVSGRKFAFYSSPEEFSVWNELDSRIDSMVTRLPHNILDIIYETTDLSNNSKNLDLFSEEEKEKFFGKKALKLATIVSLDSAIGMNTEGEIERPIVGHEEEEVNQDNWMNHTENEVMEIIEEVPVTQGWAYGNQVSDMVMEVESEITERHNGIYMGHHVMTELDMEIGYELEEYELPESEEGGTI
jgi:hypothetical protein